MAEIPTIIKPATNEEFDSFVKDCLNSEGWNLCYEKDENLKVWDQKSDKSAINILKLYAVLPNIEASILYDVLHDPDYRSVWDENMIEGYNIEQIDENNDVGYYSARAPTGISNRDFCNQRCWRVRDNKEFVIMNHSVVHPKCPEKKGFIRANSIKTGYCVLAREEGGCILVYLTQTDPRGWIPAWLTNKVTKTVAPQIIAKLEKACKAYPEWKSKHNPTYKPWLTTKNNSNSISTTNNTMNNNNNNNNQNNNNNIENKQKNDYFTNSISIHSFKNKLQQHINHWEELQIKEKQLLEQLKSYFQQLHNLPPITNDEFMLQIIQQHYEYLDQEVKQFMEHKSNILKSFFMININENENQTIVEKEKNIEDNNMLIIVQQPMDIAIANRYLIPPPSVKIINHFKLQKENNSVILCANLHYYVAETPLTKTIDGKQEILQGIKKVGPDKNGIIVYNKLKITEVSSKHKHQAFCLIFTLEEYCNGEKKKIWVL
jgi:hypothetical protein